MLITNPCQFFRKRQKASKKRLRSRVVCPNCKIQFVSEKSAKYKNHKHFCSNEHAQIQDMPSEDYRLSFGKLNINMSARLLKLTIWPLPNVNIRNSYLLQKKRLFWDHQQMSLILIKLENVHFADSLDTLNLRYINTEICLLALHIWSFLFVPTVSLLQSQIYAFFIFILLHMLQWWKRFKLKTIINNYVFINWQNWQRCWQILI